MAGATWWESSPNLRSLFPAILSATQARASTAEVWQAIRESATSAATHVLGVVLGRAPTDQEILAGASKYLQGIDAAAVSSARGVAGAMVRAHDNLVARDPATQVLADAIARPPWAITVNQQGIREQYRIRVKRALTFHGFTDVTMEEWATYDLTGPITSVADALATADTLFQQADYNRRTDINQILDYWVEAV